MVCLLFCGCLDLYGFWFQVVSIAGSSISVGVVSRMRPEYVILNESSFIDGFLVVSTKELQKRPAWFAS